MCGSGDFVKVKDKDIRARLYDEIEHYFSYDPSTLIIDEMQVCNGIVRVDLAALNGALHGYEIKSECDTLARLPRQAEYYNKVFDYMYFVCSESMLNRAEKIIPSWWGIYTATSSGDKVELQVVRKPERNCNTDKLVVLQFLNKSEAVELAATRIQMKRTAIEKKKKSNLFRMIVDQFTTAEITDFVRETLKAREHWRTRGLQT